MSISLHLASHTPPRTSYDKAPYIKTANLNTSQVGDAGILMVSGRSLTPRLTENPNTTTSTPSPQVLPPPFHGQRSFNSNAPEFNLNLPRDWPSLAPSTPTIPKSKKSRPVRSANKNDDIKPRSSVAQKSIPLHYWGHKSSPPFRLNPGQKHMPPLEPRPIPPIDPSNNTKDNNTYIPKPPPSDKSPSFHRKDESPLNLLTNETISPHEFADICESMPMKERHKVLVDVATIVSQSKPKVPHPPNDPRTSVRDKNSPSPKRKGNEGSDGEDCPFSWHSKDTNSPAGLMLSWKNSDPSSDDVDTNKRRRVAVSSQVVDEDESEAFEPKLYPKTASQMNKLKSVLKMNPLFAQLDTEDLCTVMDAMVSINFPSDHKVLVEGEESENFYVIEQGTAYVIRDEEVVAILKDGQSFGELELMYNSLCAATVLAATDLQTWVLDRPTYRHIVMKVSIQKRKLYGDLLQNIPFLECMDQYQLLTLADALESVEYQPDEYLIKYGSETGFMYIVMDGAVEVIGRDEKSAPVYVCELGWGEPVGELEFLYHHPAVADVKAKVVTKTVRLHREHFEMCMGPVADFLKDRARQDLAYSYYQNRQKQAFDWSKASEFRTTITANDDNDQTVAEGRRVGVSAGSVDLEPDWEPPYIQKTQNELDQLKDVLTKNPLFSQMEIEDLETIMNAMAKVNYKAGEMILKQGTWSNHYYVISSGECVCIKNGVEVHRFGVSEAFGELELMYNSSCAASIVAEVPVECWTLDRATYQHMVMTISMKKRRLYQNLLRQVDFLKSMSDYDILTLADALQPAYFKEGDKIIEFGSEGEWMHIILDGIVQVEGRDETGKVIEVCEFGYGDPIGELEFMHGHQCVADVIAKTSVKTVKLNRDHFEMCMGPVVDVLKERESTLEYSYYNGFDFSDFQKQMDDEKKESPERRGSNRRVAVSAKQIDENEDFEPVIVPKSAEATKTLLQTLRGNTLLCGLESNDLELVASTMWKKHYQQGDYVLKEGDESDLFYVIEKGKVAVVKKGQQVAVFGIGRSFGELELMYTAPCVASVKALEYLECWILDGNVYRRIVMRQNIEKRKLYQELLSNVDFLKSMSQYELLTLADALQPSNYKKGDKIIQFGDEAEWFHIVVDGEVEVWGRDKSGSIITVCTLSQGDSIGELEFINNHKCVADVVAQTDVKTVKLSRKHFEMCMGPVVDILNRNVSKPNYSYYSGFDFSNTDEMDSFIRSINADSPPIDNKQGKSVPHMLNDRSLSIDKRRAGRSTQLDPELKVHEYPKTQSDIEFIRSVLMQLKSVLSHFEKDDLDVLIAAMHPSSFKSGELIADGNLNHEHLIIIDQGLAKKECAQEDPVSLSRGNYFGEDQLFLQSPFNFQVTAITQVEAFILSSSEYQGIASKLAKERREKYAVLLSNLDFLEAMTHEQLLQLSDCLKPAYFPPGSKLIEFGSVGEWMHIIMQGTVEVVGRDSNGNPIKVCEFNEGQPVGELEFVNNHLCVADVVAKTEVKTARLNRNHFEICMGPVMDWIRKACQSPTYSYYQHATEGISSK